MTASPEQRDYFGAKATFDTGSGSAYIYRLDQLVKAGFTGINKLPFSIKVM